MTPVPGLEELIQLLLPHYAALPLSARHLAAADDMMYGMPEVTAELRARNRTGGIRFADVLPATFGGCNLAIVGGTKLGERDAHLDPLYAFNRRFAEIAANEQRPDGERGWSFCTGAGPGLAMKGPLACLWKARQGVSASKSLCIGVTSSLKGELPHQFIDAKAKVRPQPNTFIREAMIGCIGWDGVIAYPGYWGTYYEVSAAGFEEYCAGRDVLSSIARRDDFKLDVKLRSAYPGPIILIDREVPGSHDPSKPTPRYWDPLRTLYENAGAIGVQKSAGVAMHIVLDTDPHGPEKVAGFIRDHLVERRGMAMTDSLENGG